MFHYIIVNDSGSTHKGILSDSTALQTDKITRDGISVLKKDIDRKYSSSWAESDIPLL